MCDWALFLPPFLTLIELSCILFLEMYFYKSAEKEVPPMIGGPVKDEVEFIGSYIFAADLLQYVKSIYGEKSGISPTAREPALECILQNLRTTGSLLSTSRRD